MGLDEVELDLSTLPNGLISICGENGAGKTTLMDNLTPFRLMPYKLRESDGWSPRAFSYYKQAFGRDALKELIWEMAGIKYKSVIMIDVEKQAQECYLYQESSAGVWVPYSDNVKDGKSGAYDQAIEEICGSPAMFFSTVFRSQKAKELTAYSRGDILSIVCELLNIDHIKVQGQKAGEVVKALEAIVTSIETLKTPILQSLEGRQELLAVRDTHEAALKGSDVLAANLRVSLTGSENRIHEIELAAASETVSRRRLEEMEARERDLFKEIADGALEKTNRWTGFQTDINAVDLERSDADLAFTRDTGNVEIKIESAQVIIGRAEEIRVAADGEQTINEKLTTARAEKETCTTLYRTLAEKSKQAATGKAGIASARQEEKAETERRSARSAELGRENERCSLQVRTLAAGLDCKADGSQWINEACPLLQDAVKAKARIAEITAELVTLDDYEASIDGRLPLSKLKDTVNDLDSAWHVEFSSVEADLDACTKEGQGVALRITTLEAELKKVQETATLIFDLETAEERVKELASQLETLKSDHTQKVKTLEARRQDLVDKLQVYETETETKAADLQAKKSTLSEEIAVLKNTLNGDKDTELATVQTAIIETKKQISDVEETIRKTHAALGAVTAQLEDLDKKASSLTTFDERVARIDTEMVAWKVLAKACSNDGIIALEIDDSSGSISAIANQLLLECYGPRFSVRVETQAAKSDGGLKETFDISCFDSERDEEKSVREMSGGEAITINDAIVRAFNLFNLEKENRHYSTVFMDEGDGPLSEARKQEFFAVKRKAMEIGKHDQEYFITQTPALQELADSRILVGKGGITIQ
jgi:exonuclease SbcC